MVVSWNICEFHKNSDVVLGVESIYIQMTTHNGKLEYEYFGTIQELPRVQECEPYTYDVFL